MMAIFTATAWDGGHIYITGQVIALHSQGAAKLQGPGILRQVVCTPKCAAPSYCVAPAHLESTDADLLNVTNSTPS